MKKIIIIISMIVCIIVGILIFSNNKISNIKINKTIQEDIISEQNNSSQEYSFYFITEEGKENIIKKNICINEENKIANYIEVLFNLYKNHKCIKLSDIKVNKYYIKMGTLYIDFNKNVLKSKFKEEKYEKMFVNSIVKSLLNFINEKNNFDDVCFTVEEKVKKHAFGGTYETNNIIRIK